MRELVQLHTDYPVATIFLNHPEKHNALSGALVQALATVLKQIKQDDAIHVVL